MQIIVFWEQSRTNTPGVNMLPVTIAEVYIQTMACLHYCGNHLLYTKHGVGTTMTDVLGLHRCTRNNSLKRPWKNKLDFVCEDYLTVFILKHVQIVSK